MEEIGRYQSSRGEAFIFLFDRDGQKAKAVKLLKIPAGNASVGWPVHKVRAESESNAREKLISWVESDPPPDLPMDPPPEHTMDPPRVGATLEAGRF